MSGNNKSNEQNVIKRYRLDRLLLILTFLCTAAATIYSVRTARHAIMQAKNELRPWVIVSAVDTFLKADCMESKFKIINIGKTPAYLVIENDVFRNGELVKYPSEMPKVPISIMPGQTIWHSGFGLKGDTYKKLRQDKKSFGDEIIQSLRLKYGRDKNDVGTFWTCFKVEFDGNDIPDDPQSGSGIGIWNILETDFE